MEILNQQTIDGRKRLVSILKQLRITNQNFKLKTREKNLNVFMNSLKHANAGTSEHQGAVVFLNNTHKTICYSSKSEERISVALEDIIEISCKDVQVQITQ